MGYNYSWNKFIDKSLYYNKMIEFINVEKNICPNKEKVFRFMNCNLNDIKCIILGMDPYPSTYTYEGKEIPVATGRSFEVANVEKFTDKYKQQSLANIFKTLCYLKFGKKYSMEELRNETLINRIEYINTHLWFDEMEKQGVMFLNATLTTLAHTSGVHTKKWFDFMNELIIYINNNVKCKWLIWGKDALDRVKGLVDDKYLIYSCHPASRQNNNFIEDCCFRKVKEINWF